MPKVALSIPETIESVTRPVMLDVVRQVMKITGISAEVNIVFPGSTNETIQLNSALSTRNKDDPNKFAHNDKITIEVSEIDDPDRVQNEPVFAPGNLLIFEDPPLDVVMKPVYSGQLVTINFRYRANSQNLAIKWRDALKAKISQRRDLNVHDVTYAYGIPPEFLLILEEIHRMREAVAGYGDSFDKYFADKRHPRITMVTNQNGSASLWTMPETQSRIIGWFDFDLPEEGSKEDKANTWTTSFSYKFRYDRPTQIAMMYPLVIHNQVLSTRFRGGPIESYEDHIQSYALQTRVLVAFEGGREAREYTKRFGYSIPTFDEFMPDQVPHYSMRLLEIGTLVDDVVPELLLNLGELGERAFHPDIIEYLKAEAAYITKPLGSAIHLNLYRSRFLINPTPLAVDADLNVRATTPPNLRVSMHIRIGLLTDLRLMKGNALDRLQDHGRAAILMLRTIDPTLESRGHMPKLVGDNFVSKAALRDAITHVRPLNYVQGNVMNTVQFLVLSTERATAAA